METLRELLPAGDAFSLRGSSIVKHVIRLLAEHRLPFRYFDRALTDERFRTRLLQGFAEEDVHYYFDTQFPSESRATIAAVRARIASSLFPSESMKLALSGPGAPDFRRLQDDGSIVLINCAGPCIPRPTARTLQALILSDIRQGVFSRAGRNPFHWIDESQYLFRTNQLRENVSDLSTQARSFGSFFLFLTQNLSAAVHDGDVQENLYTNTRWSIVLRGSPRDGAFLQAAFPLTGCLQKPRTSPYDPAQFYAPAEERSLLLAGLAHLPDRTGWLWLKSLLGEAIKIKTATLDLPKGDEFHKAVESIRSNANIGHRIDRTSYMQEIARRDAELLRGDTSDQLEKLKRAYKEQEGLN